MRDWVYQRTPEEKCVRRRLTDTRASDYITPLTRYHESSEGAGSSNLDSNYISLTLLLGAMFIYFISNWTSPWMAHGEFNSTYLKQNRLSLYGAVVPRIFILILILSLFKRKKKQVILDSVLFLLHLAKHYQLQRIYLLPSSWMCPGSLSPDIFLITHWML